MSQLISPASVALLQAISQHGSLSAAARELGLVPSALSYQIRQLEQALDALLLDRSNKRASLTPAGTELMLEGARVLGEFAAITERVRRISAGWEPNLTIAVDSLINETVIFELCEGFFALKAPTRLKLVQETLSGTLDALSEGRADLAIGIALPSPRAEFETQVLGESEFVFVVAPMHPLTRASGPISEQLLAQHRIVAISDSTRSQQTVSVGILPGQDVLTVSSMQAKLAAQVRGLGCGFLPRFIAQNDLDAGRLVALKTERQVRQIKVHYAWRRKAKAAIGPALNWWLEALTQPTTRRALLAGYSFPGGAGAGV